MAMNVELQVATAIAGVNIVLLGVLTVVWLRNYRTFRSELVLGLVAFGAVMLFENAVAIYFFFSMKMFYAADPTVQTAVATLRGLQLVAVAFLTYVTLK